MAAYHVLDRRQPYADLGADYFVRRFDPKRHADKLVRQLQSIGYKVSLEPVEAA